MPQAVQSELFSALFDDILTSLWNADSWQLDTACVYALVPTGKLFRSNLMLQSTVAVGADPRTVLPAAAALEHAHAASLVHDDVVDGDMVRRGRESVLARYGPGKAIMVGDALFFEFFAVLGECRHSGVPDGRIVDATRVFAQAGIDLCRGQFQEAEMVCDLSCGLTAYLEMATLKTGALCGAACEVGAILGGAPPEWAAALREYGRCLGLAFQIQDDILPYVADCGRVGKNRNSDVRNGRITLPVLLAYASGTEADRTELTELYRGDRSGPRAHELLATLVERTGALTMAGGMAAEWGRRACDQLSVLPPSAGQHTLTGIALSVLDRRN